MITEPSIDDYRELVGSAIYLIDESGVLKLFGLDEDTSCVKLHVSYNLAGYNIISLIKETDSLLLQTVRDKNKFILLDPFSGVWSDELVLFNESNQLSTEGKIL